MNGSAGAAVDRSVAVVPPSSRLQFSAEEIAVRTGQQGRPTAEQAAVIEAPLSAAVVIAGAGSGKTETMASRVVWLVANGLVPADAVLGLTFTRKAAAELGARIRRRLRAWAHQCDPEQQAVLRLAEPTVLTYAAYCGRLVVDHGLRLGLEPATRLLSPAAVWQLADAVVRHYAGEMDDTIGVPGSVVDYVTQLSGELSDHLSSVDAVESFTAGLLAHIDGLPPGPKVRVQYPNPLDKLVQSLRHRQQLLPLVRLFREAKLNSGAVDFADQLEWAARLAGLAPVQAAERDRYRAVLLDEYQDTGHAQIQLLRALYAGGHPVTAVGDPFQSIYGWRGASSGNIERFAFDFASSGNAGGATFFEGAAVAANAALPAPGVARFTLSTSWRNDDAILDAANAVAAPLRRLYPSSIALSARPAAPRGAVAAAVVETVEDEAQWVAAQLAAAWDNLGAPRTAAVLVRRRSQIPLLAEALRAAGLPVEIVGLGGLLTTPEVGDVVATLHVLADYDPGPALLRLLTGARWRIGPRDLAALARRARELAAGPPVEPPVGPPADPPVDPSAPRSRSNEPGSIVEALDDLGPPARFSATGYRRLATLGGEIRRLRRRVAAPLPDLIAEVEQVIGVDVEVLARADKAAVGRAHLDRFLDTAADFSVDADQATLPAFLAFLRAAEDEENGLAQAEIEVVSERVQVLTVHGSKGLEWDVVAVPGLVRDVFPSAARSHDWTRARQLLPFPLRGDAGDLPQFELYGALDRRELAGRLETRAADAADDLKSAMTKMHLREERRLAYVAFTRARSKLFLSGYVWDAAVKPREPAAFLNEAVAAGATVDRWVDFADLPDGALNPHEREPVTVAWPFDPLDTRRAAVEAGADLVRRAMSRGRVDPDTTVSAGEAAGESGSGIGLPAAFAGSPSAAVAGWQRDVEILLAERAAARSSSDRAVRLPSTLSVSQLVALHQDPADFARRLARPQPSAPAPLARRGTAFHLWLERLWQGEHLLDLDELPGAADDSAVVAADLEHLQQMFLSSAWSARRPHEIEVPFEMVVAGVVVRGRMDAVFEEEPDVDGRARWLVVDWKTGAMPVGAHARSVAVQLAAYRLAWQRIVSTAAAPVALDQVRAAFHYVAADTTVAPADLLDATGLRDLITGVASREQNGYSAHIPTMSSEGS